MEPYVVHIKETCTAIIYTAITATITLLYFTDIAAAQLLGGGSMCRCCCVGGPGCVLACFCPPKCCK